MLQVTIKMSRHARNRIRLYGIPEGVIQEMLAGKKFAKGNHEVVGHVEGFKYPIKIVVSVGDVIMVITAYPLKKRKKQ